MNNRSGSFSLAGVGLVVAALALVTRGPAVVPTAERTVEVVPVTPARDAGNDTDDVAHAIAAYDQGRRLIADYVASPFPSGDCGAVVADGASEGTRPALHVTIATVPDPYDSHLDWSYDASLEALRRAMGSAGYVPQSFWLPSRNDSLSLAVAGKAMRYAAHDVRPGVFLFRSIAQDEPSVRLVYIVPELPTSGVHMQAFRAALLEREAIMRCGQRLFRVDDRERVELSVLGPNFSGSAPSLRALLDSALRAANATPGPADVTPRSARVISGTATSFSNLETLSSTDSITVPRRDSTGTERVPRIQFRATVNPDGAMDDALRDVLTSLGIRPNQVAVLAEAGTAYGAARLDSTQQRPDTSGATAAGRGTVAATTAPVTGKYFTIPFPLNIGSLRTEFERSPEAAAAPSAVPGLSESPRTRLSLDEASRARETPALTSNLSVASLDVVLDGIMRTLNEHDTRVVVIKATDVRDKLFLAREVRRGVRDVILVMYEGHVLLRRPEFASALRGALVFSSYPMLLENQYWASSHRDAHGDVTYVRLDQLLAFPTDAATGVYNAAVTLFDHPERRTESVVHNARGNDSVFAYPPVWLSVVGRDGFYPLRTFLPAERWRAYLVDPPVAAVAGADSSDMLHEHSYTRNGVWLSVLLVAPAVLILALLVMFLMGRTTLNGMGVVMPSALARPATAKESLFLGLFVLSLSATYLPFSVAVDARRIIASVDQNVGGLSMALWLVMALTAVSVLVGVGLLVNGVWGVCDVRSRPDAALSTGGGASPSMTPDQPIPAVERQSSGEASWPDLAGIRGVLRDMRGVVDLHDPAPVGMVDEFPQQTVRAEAEGMHRLGMLAIAVVCTAFIVSSLAYTTHLVLMSRAGGVEATLSMYRALHLASGVSPLFPLGLLGTACGSWTWWQLQQARSFDRPDHFENGVRTLACANSAAARWRRAYRAMVDARRGLSWIAPGFGAVAILSALVVVCWLTLSHRVPSIELLTHAAGKADGWFDLALWVGLSALLVATSWAIYRLALTWSALERFLDIVGGSPLACAFVRLPLDVVRLTDVGFLGFRRDRRSDALYADEQWKQAQAEVVAATGTEGAGRLAAVFDDTTKRGADVPRGEASIGFALETLRRAWELARTRPDPDRDTPLEDSDGGRPQARAMRALEEYAACEIVLYVERYLRNLRRLCVFLFSSLLILVTVNSQYPYEPHSVVGIAALVLLVLTIATVFVTMVRMSRNGTLSRISRTEPGKVTWDTTLILNMVTFGVVPLLALVSSEFPELRSFLFSWAEPFVRAVAKS